jgi:hypothetical protein
VLGFEIEGEDVANAWHGWFLSCVSAAQPG